MASSWYLISMALLSVFEVEHRMLQVVSHNVRRFRFRLPDKKMVVGLPTGLHITIAAKDVDGKDVMRPYTPVTDDTSKGYVDFVIKVKHTASSQHLGYIIVIDPSTPVAVNSMWHACSTAAFKLGACVI